MATKTAIVLVQDGSIVETTYDAKEQLAVMQAAVGGYIEGVDGYGFGMDAYANESGLDPALGFKPNIHMFRVFGQVVMGNVVIPAMTPTKRTRLIKKGFQVKSE